MMMAVVPIWISVEGGHGSHGALQSQRYRHIDLVLKSLRIVYSPFPQ
jgi:hypothetical protein